jgi:hypothetical protein
MAPIQLDTQPTAGMNPFCPNLTRLARTLSLAPTRRYQISVGLPKLSLCQLCHIHHTTGLAIHRSLKPYLNTVIPDSRGISSPKRSPQAIPKMILSQQTTTHLQASKINPKMPVVPR